MLASSSTAVSRAAWSASLLSRRTVDGGAPLRARVRAYRGRSSTIRSAGKTASTPAATARSRSTARKVSISTTARGRVERRLVQVEATAEGSPSPGPVPITSMSGRLPAVTASGSSFRVRRSHGVAERRRSASVSSSRSAPGRQYQDAREAGRRDFRPERVISCAATVSTASSRFTASSSLSAAVAGGGSDESQPLGGAGDLADLGEAVGAARAGQPVEPGSERRQHLLALPEGVDVGSQLREQLRKLGQVLPAGARGRRRRRRRSWASEPLEGEPGGRDEGGGGAPVAPHVAAVPGRRGSRSGRPPPG